ncbi:MULTISPECIES: hypothetical protein [unclassified Rickettsia]|nr:MULTISPECIES: hypothetical protein [unclassified Rickettsia]
MVSFYRHCEERRSIDAAISGCLTRLLRRFAPRNDELGRHRQVK